MGLGDHALFSTLPERFAALGHKVFLDEDTYARNDETLDIFWKRNPHIEGLTDRKPNAGYHTHHGAFYDELQKYPEGANLEVMERVHGLPPPYSIAPRIYYTPGPFYHDLADAVLWDYSALSSTILDDGWQRFMQKMDDRFGLSDDTTPTRCVLVQHTAEVGGRRQLQLPIRPEMIGVSSIYQYIDMLAVCRAWVGSEAGGQALAAAVRGERTVWEYDARPEVVSLMTVGTRNSLAFCYRGVTYRSSLSSITGGDYLEPAEVPLHRYHQTCKINGMARLEEWRAAR
jgi:hypothetical protein